VTRGTIQRALLVGAFGGLVLLGGACTGDDTSEPPEPRAGETTTSDGETPTGTDAEPTTTTTPAPTSSPTTPATSAVALPPALQPPTDPAAWVTGELPAGANLPCCAEQWRLPASPALPAPTEPLADGVYSFEILGWGPEDPLQRMRLLVQPFVACTESTETYYLSQCEQPYEPDTVGVDISQGIVTAITLDEEVTVGYTGFAGCEAGSTEWTSPQWVTTGVGLGDLLDEINTDYAEPIWMPLVNDWWGVTEEQILGNLRADPDSPFTVEPCGMSGAISWTSSDGVGVLLQMLGWPDADGANARQPWQFVRPATLQVHDGQITLLVEGSYQS
jgi:hypothetical protein